ncbi:dTMP kinase [Ornithinicoccus hortensis]
MPVDPPVCRMADSGLFVAFEGGDGAGKSTQIRLLGQALVARGQEVLTTREPGGTPVGTAIREVLLHGDHVAPRAEALLFAADRAHHVATVIEPALGQGRTVLTDRYMDSSIAYQAAARGLDAGHVRGLSLWATGGLVPHLTVLLDVDSGTGHERRGDVHDRLESEGRDFHDRVRQGFLDLASAEPDRYLVLDATLPAESLHEQVLTAVTDLAGVAAR